MGCVLRSSQCRMSEGKPSGADQSTSNGGGGGDLGERIGKHFAPECAPS